MAGLRRVRGRVGKHVPRDPPRQRGPAAVVALGFAQTWRAGIGVVPCVALLLSATLAALSLVLLKRGPRQPPFGANAVGAVVGLAVCLTGSIALREPHHLPHGVAAWWPV